jgi:hypothetical protein
LITGGSEHIVATMSSETRSLRFWSEADGKRVPVVLTVTPQLVILNVTIGGEKAAVSDLVGNVASDGARITAIPNPRVAKLMRFFSEETPCWFEGCAEMRAEFYHDIDSLEKSAEAVGAECRNCDRGEVIKRYIARLIELGVE